MTKHTRHASWTWNPNTPTAFHCMHVCLSVIHPYNTDRKKWVKSQMEILTARMKPAGEDNDRSKWRRCMLTCETICCTKWSQKGCECEMMKEKCRVGWGGVPWSRSKHCFPNPQSPIPAHQDVTWTWITLDANPRKENFLRVKNFLAVRNGTFIFSVSSIFSFFFQFFSIFNTLFFVWGDNKSHFTLFCTMSVVERIKSIEDEVWDN